MKKVELPIWLHSKIYYRNTFIVLGVTLFVLAMAVSKPFDWISILVIVLGICCNYLLWQAYLQVHPRRINYDDQELQINFSHPYEQVKFYSEDGMAISGLWIPGTRPQTLLLLHNIGGACTDMIRRAHLLNQVGYCILLIDFRAHGNSEGDTAFSGEEIYDVFGALEFLDSRPDVRTDLVGIWGVSYGAQIGLQAAGTNKKIGLLLLENLDPANFKDHSTQNDSMMKQVSAVFCRLLYWIRNWMSGDEQPNSVLETLHIIYPRPIVFLSSGSSKEQFFSQQFFDAARQPKSLIKISSNLGQQEVNQEIFGLIEQVLGSSNKPPSLG
jgi:pimeloyl-ACP methyl ester carboxylesterase